MSGRGPCRGILSLPRPPLIRRLTTGVPAGLHMRAFRFGFLALILAASCSKSATSPTTTTSVPHAPVTNAPPVITSITLSPSDRTEVDSDVTVTASVTDAETAVSNLQFTWSAPIGQFSGSGPVVKWRVPKGTTTTPVSITLRLDVTETYTQYDATGKPFTATNKVSGSATPILVHDSVKEISAMVVHFLVDLFGNSGVTPQACVVDFWDGCAGKNQELGEIVTNRQTRILISAQATVSSVTFDSTMTHAAVEAPCAFHDKDAVTGVPANPSGNCELTAQYHDGRWWICVSSFCVPGQDPGCGPLAPTAESEHYGMPRFFSPLP